MCSVISNTVLQNIHVCLLVSEKCPWWPWCSENRRPKPRNVTNSRWPLMLQSPWTNSNNRSSDARCEKDTKGNARSPLRVRRAMRVSSHRASKVPAHRDKGMIPNGPWSVGKLRRFEDVPPIFHKKKHVMSCFPAKICMQHKHTCEIRISNNMPNKMQKSTSNKMFCVRSDVKIYVRQKVKVYSKQNAN